MKIAVSTQDGNTICGHLGKCRNFLIYQAEDGNVLEKRLVSAGGACPGHGHAGHDGGTGRTHSHNVDPFAGCHAVITQGMGQGMLNALAGAGIRPVITALSDPDEAVRLFLSGELSETGTSTCGCGHHEHQ